MNDLRPVYLVGCCGKKLDHAAPARELYQSSLFKLAVAFAKVKDAPWAILSALHGLVLPDQWLEPYDLPAMALRARGRGAMSAWGREVAEDLEKTFPRSRFVFLAGSDYRAAVAGFSAGRVDEPLAGLGIGERLRWLKREAGQLAGAVS